MKPGIKTTEFWMAMVVVIGGAAASVYGAAEWAKAVGIVAAALASAGYGFSRSQAKSAKEDADARVQEEAQYTARELIRQEEKS